MTDSPLYVIVYQREDGSIEVDDYPNSDLLFMQRVAAERGDSFRVAELRYIDEED